MKKTITILIYISSLHFVFSQDIDVKLYNDTIYATKEFEIFNRVSYSITNNTNQKQLFIIDNKGLRYSNFNLDDDSVDKDNLMTAYVVFNNQMIIRDSKNKEIGLNDCYIPRSTMSFFNDSIIKNSKNKDIFFKNYISKYIIILNPKEEYFISKYNQLPNHSNEGNTYIECLNMKINSDNYFFDIVINQSRNYILSILPDYYINYLKEQEVNIFDGEIKSNSGMIKWIFQ